MFWLGLLLSVCYVPGYTGASVPTQWAVLALVLPLGVWRRSIYNPGHTLLFIGLCYALLSVLWSLNLYTWGWGAFMAMCWLLAYHWGTLVADLSGMWKGVGVGLSISTAVAVAQAFDYTPVLGNELQLSGLFYNSSLFGVLCGLVIVALVCQRSWWYLPPISLGLILSGSRGGILIATVGLLARFGGPIAAASVMIVGGLAFTLTYDLADAQRLQIWGVALRGIDSLGYGAGSFLDIIYYHDAKGMMIRPEYAHNDFIQLTYELGIGAIFVAAVPIMALLVGRRHTYFPVLAAWLSLACFYFPLYTPLTAFLGLVVAGHLMRGWVDIRDVIGQRGYDLLLGITEERSTSSLAGRETIPSITRTTPSES